ncbi:MAG: alanine--tRNA ligase [Sulfolobales archaeon]|nr:alanine--tRNA ligase [Sulfolobales archaeon]
MSVKGYWEKLRIDFLPSSGYRKYTCKVCGSDFWSMTPRNTCNDVPCSEYNFFSVDIRSPKLNSLQARNKFLNFFAKLNHAVIEPKPVVARWREDLYLTIASIVVFQPHVTSGNVPPPANPLVIAQPCIRLEDIDVVGYTLGRHLTNFIMGGHHAFNYPDKYVYFANETVEYARKFFVDEVGVPEDELTFKESWWEGGGNAGPCLEVCVGGLEVATLVFMMFKNLDNGGYAELPLKIVDTGYGIERIAWLTSKTPTAFHTVYGELLSKYLSLLDLEEAPTNVLWRAIKLVSKYDVKKSESYVSLKNLIAEDLGLTIEDVSDALDNMVKVFTLLDHVKTSLLLLSDGVVPSNAGEGYLARLVLRRIFRLLKTFNKLDVIEELFGGQIAYWRELYPNIGKATDYIYDVVRSELDRFGDVLRKSSTILKKYVSDRKLDVRELVELYDSHGLPPDLVVDECRKFGVEVELPTNFYSLIASRHSRPPIKPVKAVKLPQEVLEKLIKLPPTRRLFHEDPYIKTFTAKVLDAYSRYLVLDQTAFYPEGGGQESDVGVVRINGEQYKVTDVQKVGDVVVHVVDRDLRAGLAGVEVEGAIDWFRRYSLMRHHTATHIVLASARKVLGSHVWQAGAEKSEDRSRLDITHFRGLSKEEIKRIEDIANESVLNCLAVNTTYIPRYDAESKYGFTLYQGGVPMDPIIRVVEIQGVDAQACFGTHLRNTCEVGGIKLINVQRIQDGIVRLEFVAGTQLVKHVRSIEGLIDEATSLVGGSDLIKRIKSINEELTSIKNLLNAYRKVWLDNTYQEVVRSVEEINGIRHVVKLFKIDDKEIIRELLKELISRNSVVAIALVPEGGSKVYVEISISSDILHLVNATDIFNEVSRVYGGRGGGKRDHVSGYITIEGMLDEAVNNIRKLIKDFLIRSNT